jgi:uncharacterized protein (DUF3084 family)
MSDTLSTMWKKSKRWSGLITVVGALFIFLGTLVSGWVDRMNADYSKMDAARKEVEVLKNMNRMGTQMAILLRQAPPLNEARSRKRAAGHQELEKLGTEYADCFRLLNYVKSQRELVDLQLRLVRAQPDHSTLTYSINDTKTQLTKLIDKLEDSADESRRMLNTSDQVAVSPEQLKAVKVELKQFEDVCTKHEEECSTLCEALTKQSSKLWNELEKKLDKYRNTWWIRTLYVSLYFAGSLLALYGQAADKGSPKDEKDSANKDNNGDPEAPKTSRDNKLKV